MSLNRVCTVCEDVYDVTTVHVCPPMKDWPESQILAAIHDEQRTQTGLLTDLRGAIDDLAEVLRPEVDHDRIGSRCTRPNCMELHDPEPEHGIGLDGKCAQCDPEPDYPAPCANCGTAYDACMAMRDRNKRCCGSCAYRITHDQDEWEEWNRRQPPTTTPEPESVTVTLPRDVVEAYTSGLWRQTAFDLRHSGERKAAGVLDALADALDAATTPNPATGDDLSAPQPTEAPADGEGTERPTAANLGRIGWLEVSNLAPRQLAREVSDGWSKDEHFGAGAATWDRRDWTEAAFTPFTPADFGWTVLGEGQVAVDREDLEWMRPREMHRSEADDFRAARDRLIAALDGSQS